jgi:hypothetical protein
MLAIALKEWAIVCDLLLEGRLALLLRKGGIHEKHGPGEFELEHRRFLLYPSWMHQKREMIKPEVRERVVVMGKEPEEVTFAGVGEAAKIWLVPGRAAMDRLDDLHCWTAAQIDMRFNYRPENPLYLMAVRTSHLARPRTVANLPAYAGCKSWVPLVAGDETDDAGAKAVLDDAAFQGIIARVDETFGTK